MAQIKDIDSKEYITISDKLYHEYCSLVWWLTLGKSVDGQYMLPGFSEKIERPRDMHEHINNKNCCGNSPVHYWVCTRLKGHSGKHIGHASDGDAHGVWENKDDI